MQSNASSNGISSDSTSLDAPLHIEACDAPLRIEAWAQIEEHFQGSDRLIAAWLAPRGSRRLNVVYVANLRETNFPWWRHLEGRALTEIRLPREREQSAREYLTGYVRPSRRRASLMARMSPDWLGYLLLCAGTLIFFVPALFPHLAETVSDFLKTWI